MSWREVGVKILMIFIALALCTCLSMYLSGCGGPTVETEYNSVASASMFVEVEYQPDAWRVVYHRETKVMYVISLGSYNRGTFTVMLNPDGTPQLWKGY